jgi:hypothetical protein
MHSNVMLRFMVQAQQDPPLCSSTWFETIRFENHSSRGLEQDLNYEILLPRVLIWFAAGYLFANLKRRDICEKLRDAK